ncbi:MAG: thiamine pyrophosphate-binding protein, partial [Anaerolineaceae bacterium]
MITVADTLAQILMQHGIDTVFGLPGGANLPLLAALRRHDIRFVLVRNESSAVYMADVTARLTGKPGVCIATLGPGAANMMAGVAHAYLDRSPILIVTADFPSSLQGRHTHQTLDLQALFHPVTKHTARLLPTQATQQIQQALDLAITGRPGPVHLSLTGADADTLATSQAILPSAPPTPQVKQDVLNTAQALFAQARRPVIVTGLGLEPERPYVELRKFAQARHAPLIDTPKSKGALAHDHPLFAGTIGLTLTDPAYAILDEADCIVSVGFDVVELVRIWDYTVPIIWIAPWANADPAIVTTVELVGPMRSVLRQLTFSPNWLDPAWGEARVARFRAQLAGQSLPPPAAGRLLPQQLLHTLRQIVPKDTLITTDVGSHKILTALEWPAYTPNRFMVSNGLSAMGFGLPAAMAAAFCLRQPVICITGDAGIGMVLGELSLLKELDLPVIIIVMNDASLDLIRAKQMRRGDTIYGTEFANPDFGQLAGAFDLHFRQANSEPAFHDALHFAFDAHKPTLIEALIDPTAYPTSAATRPPTS